MTDTLTLTTTPSVRLVKKKNYQKQTSIDMFAYELLPKLIHLTMIVDNEAEYWEDRIEFVGTLHQHTMALAMENEYYNQ